MNNRWLIVVAGFSFALAALVYGILYMVGISMPMYNTLFIWPESAIVLPFAVPRFLDIFLIAGIFSTLALIWKNTTIYTEIGMPLGDAIGLAIVSLLAGGLVGAIIMLCTLRFSLQNPLFLAYVYIVPVAIANSLLGLGDDSWRYPLTIALIVCLAISLVFGIAHGIIYLVFVGVLVLTLKAIFGAIAWAQAGNRTEQHE